MMALRKTLLSVSRNLTSATRLSSSSTKHNLPELPYKYDALEPVISCEIMELHHKKHHQAYVTNYNNALDKIKEAASKKDIQTVTDLTKVLKFNGGGHINHSIFWKNLTPGGSKPEGNVLKAICTAYGSFDKFQKEMISRTVGIQGSGWGWLGYSKASKRVRITTTNNQDPLFATKGMIPLLGIDVWEHAYYLQYKNVRADYVHKIFEIINWADVGERFDKEHC